MVSLEPPARHESPNSLSSATIPRVSSNPRADLTVPAAWTSAPVTLFCLPFHDLTMGKNSPHGIMLSLRLAIHSCGIVDSRMRVPIASRSRRALLLAYVATTFCRNLGKHRSAGTGRSRVFLRTRQKSALVARGTFLPASGL